MSLHYQHSETMSIVKTVDEKIKGNFSSSQYVEVLETMLLNAINPIMQCTSFVDTYVSGIIHHYMENGRRKISNTDKYNLLSRSLLFLACDASKKPSVYKSLRLERNLTAIIVKDFLDATSKYKSLKQGAYKNGITPDYLIEIGKIESSVGYFGRLDLYSVIHTAQLWYSKYCQFRNSILEKYMRMVTLQAQKFYTGNKSNVELDDLIQNYIMFAAKAIDKFDHRQGTLTSYIMNWLNHARNVTVSNEGGTAFILPPNKRRECKVNNMSVSMEDSCVKALEIDTTEDIERLSEIDRVQYLARLADPNGYARMALGISEKLSNVEIDALKKYAVMNY